VSYDQRENATAPHKQNEVSPSCSHRLHLAWGDNEAPHGDSWPTFTLPSTDSKEEDGLAVNSKDIAARKPLHSLARFVCASHRTHYTCRSKGKVVITLCLSYCMPCLRPTPDYLRPTSDYPIPTLVYCTSMHHVGPQTCTTAFRRVVLVRSPCAVRLTAHLFCVGRYLPVLARPQKLPLSLQRSVVRTRDGLWNQ
jgi:hypothetical protein